MRIESLIDNSSPLLATVLVGFTEPGSTEPLDAVAKDSEPSNGMVGEVELESREKLNSAAVGIKPVAVDVRARNTSLGCGLCSAGIA